MGYHMGWAPWARLLCAPLAPSSMWTNLGFRTSCQPSPLWRACQGPIPAPTAVDHTVQAARCFLPPGTGIRPLFGRLVTAVGPFVPAFLCLPTLCLGKWESQHVCYVNTSWNPVIEIAEGMRPHPPAAQALGSSPSLHHWGGLTSG